MSTTTSPTTNQCQSVLKDTVAADSYRTGAGLARPNPETYGSGTRPLQPSTGVEAEKPLLEGNHGEGGVRAPSQVGTSGLPALRRVDTDRPEHSPTEGRVTRRRRAPSYPSEAEWLRISARQKVQ